MLGEKRAKIVGAFPDARKSKRLDVPEKLREEEKGGLSKADTWWLTKAYPEVFKRWKEVSSGLLTLAQETIPENNESYPGSDQGTFLGLDGTAVHQLTLKVMHLHMDLMAYLVSTGRKLVLKGQGLTDVNKEEEKRYLVSSNKREDMSKRAEQELALVIEGGTK